MSAKKKFARAHSAVSREDPAVADFLSKLEHPLKQEFAVVRKMILGVSLEIREGIKWNAPSFRTADWFATFLLRTRDRVKLIFHSGAKKKGLMLKGKIPGAAGFIQWLAADRCMVTLGAGKEIQKHRAAFVSFVRAWIHAL
jgi:hypothetical protein